MAEINLSPESSAFIEQKPFSHDGDDRPYFSFRYICQRDFCMKNCSYEQLKGLSDKLRILSDLTWNVIESSPRETNGFERMPQKAINATPPAVVNDDEPLLVFRFGGTGRRSGRMAGIKRSNKFYVLFIESAYGELYDH